MARHINKPTKIRTRDENGNYVTIDVQTGRRATNATTKQSTTISRQPAKQSLKRKLKPGEHVFTDWRTGEKTVFAPKRSEISSDNRSEYQRHEDQKTADILHQKHEQQKTTEEGLKNLDAITKVVSPSTYLGPLANKVAQSIQNGKQDSRSLGEQILSGEGTGDTSGNLLLDFASPYLFSKFPKATNALYKFTQPVTERIIGRTPFRGTYLSSFLSETPSIKDYGKFYRTNFVDQNLYFKGPSEYKSRLGGRGYSSQSIDVTGKGFVPKDDPGSVFLYSKDGEIINSDGTRGDMFSTVYSKLTDDETLKKVGITKNHSRKDVSWHGVERTTLPQEEQYIHGESSSQPIMVDQNFNLQPKPAMIEGDAPKVWSQSNTPFDKNYSRYIVSPANDYKGELADGVHTFRQKNFRVTDNLPLRNATMFEYDPVIGSFSNNKFVLPKLNFHYGNNTLRLSPSDFFIPKFKSKLDWSPEGWFGRYRPGGQYDAEDVASLNAHIPEYNQIEQQARANGTWMKDSDGRMLRIDPREWIVRQSKDYKAANLTGQDHYTGVSGENALNYSYNGDAWTDLEKNISQSFKDQHTAVDGKPGVILKLDYPKSSKKVTFDSQGRIWYDLPKDNFVEGYPKNAYDATAEEAVRQAKNQGYDVSRFNNIVEGNRNNVTDVVIHSGTPRKSVLGNNGNFDIADRNIYRALAPLIIGSGAYSASNYNFGKDIHIKPSKRGTFTKAAKQHGMSVQGFANRVLKNPTKYSSTMRKKANFARNAAKWKH